MLFWNYDRVGIELDEAFNAHKDKTWDGQGDACLVCKIGHYKTPAATILFLFVSSWTESVQEVLLSWEKWKTFLWQQKIKWYSISFINILLCKKFETGNCVFNIKEKLKTFWLFDIRTKSFFTMMDDDNIWKIWIQNIH